jgi:hypothetical protein
VTGSPRCVTGCPPPGVASRGRGAGWLVFCPFDVDAGGVEVAAVGASALAGGQHGDGEERGQDGAAAAEVEPVGAVGSGAVPDLGDVGVPSEPDQRVGPRGGGEGVLDLNQSVAEFAGAGPQLGESDGALGEGGGEVGEALAVAVAGPLLVTVRVSVKVSPSATGSAESASETATSAPGTGVGVGVGLGAIAIPDGEEPTGMGCRGCWWPHRWASPSCQLGW